MVCHECGQPAVGQCQWCSKFYCSAHGDKVCVTCGRKWNRIRAIVLPLVLIAFAALVVAFILSVRQH
jgi:hypothetical protein